MVFSRGWKAKKREKKKEPEGEFEQWYKSKRPDISAIREAIAQRGGERTPAQTKARTPFSPEMTDWIRSRQPTSTPTPTTPTGTKGMYDTYEEALKAAPAGWEPELTEFGLWSFRRVPTKGQFEEGGEFFKTYKEAAVAAPEGFVPYQMSNGWWGFREADDEGITEYQQGQLSLQEKQMEQSRLENEMMMGWYQQQAQMQQQEQERQYKSQLMANPMSWLQYSSYTGQTPVVQEWMKPLMSGQYQTGQQIPGWTGGQEEGQAMGSLPELRTPSAQLWGRMGPTAQAQYMGYGQARTGIRPEETAFRLGATAPPSGRFGGLRRMR